MVCSWVWVAHDSPIQRSFFFDADLKTTSVSRNGDVGVRPRGSPARKHDAMIRLDTKAEAAVKTSAERGRYHPVVPERLIQVTVRFQTHQGKVLVEAWQSS